MGFSALSKDDPVYHYHSNYDSFHWMEKFGDPAFDYHVAMTKIWGLIALNLCESPVVQFNVTNYARDLGRYLEAITNELEKRTEVCRDVQVCSNGGFSSHLKFSN